MHAKLPKNYPITPGFFLSSNPAASGHQKSFLSIPLIGRLSSGQLLYRMIYPVMLFSCYLILFFSVSSSTQKRHMNPIHIGSHCLAVTKPIQFLNFPLTILQLLSFLCFPFFIQQLLSLRSRSRCSFSTDKECLDLLQQQKQYFLLPPVNVAKTMQSNS